MSATTQPLQRRRRYIAVNSAMIGAWAVASILAVAAGQSTPLAEGALLAVALAAWWAVSWRRAQRMPLILIAPLGTIVSAMLFVTVVGPTGDYQAVHPDAPMTVGVSVAVRLMYLLAPTWPLATIVLSVIRS